MATIEGLALKRHGDQLKPPRKLACLRRAQRIAEWDVNTRTHSRSSLVQMDVSAAGGATPAVLAV
jgi:hypothetical protein